jgi:hypothetical protein
MGFKELVQLFHKKERRVHPESSFAVENRMRKYKAL